MLNQKLPKNNEQVQVLSTGVNPVLDTELASYLALSDSDGLQLFIDSATQMLEDRHGIAIVPTEYKYTATYHQASKGYVGFTSVPAIRADYITLPTANATTVTSVKENGQTVMFTSLGNKVYTNAVCNIEILYSAGYTEAPADIKQAVLKLAAYMYEQRGACSQGDPITASGAAISKYMVYI